METKNKIKQLGEKMKKARMLSGLNQRDFAELMNVNQTTISSWERGTTLPTLDKFLEICDLFKLSSDYLLSTDHFENSTSDLSQLTYQSLYSLFCKNKINYDLDVLSSIIKEEYINLCLDINNHYFYQFIIDQEKMLKLLESNLITKDIYINWYNSTIRRLDIPINEENESYTQEEHQKEIDRLLESSLEEEELVKG